MIRITLVLSILLALPAAAGSPPVFLYRWGGYGSDPGRLDNVMGIARSPDGRIVTSEWARRQWFHPSGQLDQMWVTNGTGIGIDCDAAGFVYLVDQGHSRILKYSPAGALVTYWGSYGQGDGQFERAYDVAVAGDGSVYVSDWYLKRVTKFAPDGTFLLQWGLHGGGIGQFNGIAVGPSGDVYVTDPLGNRVQRFDADGTYLGEFGNTGGAPGQLYSPIGITVDAAGRVYVVEASYSQSGVSCFTATGGFEWRFGTFSTSPGPGQFGDPRDVAVGTDGRVYVADRYGYISVFGDPATPARPASWGSVKARYR